MTTTRTIRIVRSKAALAAVAAAVVLAGCSGAEGGGSDAAVSDMSQQQAESAPQSADQQASDQQAAGQESSGQKANGSAGQASGQGSTAAAPRPRSDAKLVRDARLSLEVDDVTKAANEVRAISLATGGTLVSESLGTSSPYPYGYDYGSPESDTGQPSVGGGSPAGATAQNYGVLVLSVPSKDLDQVVTRLSRIGDVISRDSSTQDVTWEYTDTQSRLKTMERSIARVRALLDDATALEQVITLENELARREADLEALQSQFDSLADRVSSSSVTVSLTTDPALVSAVPDETSTLGSAFAAGWDAFMGVTALIITALGGLLPLLVLLALIGVPLVLFARRRAARRSA
ncbi:DUF4349 domain-containing protein [Janibacter sp. G1551]|uniref:DUF4349 domain-containing protein n=1 Tax=Janibacter sp. G1551 TaxID=3420440 RepID=UPI003D007C5C